MCLLQPRSFKMNASFWCSFLRAVASSERYSCHICGKSCFCGGWRCCPRAMACWRKFGLGCEVTLAEPLIGWILLFQRLPQFQLFSWFRLCQKQIGNLDTLCWWRFFAWSICIISWFTKPQAAVLTRLRAQRDPWDHHRPNVELEHHRINQLLPFQDLHWCIFRNYDICTSLTQI